jgi:hypothetical protein
MVLACGTKTIRRTWVVGRVGWWEGRLLRRSTVWSMLLLLRRWLLIARIIGLVVLLHRRRWLMLLRRWHRFLLLERE